MRPLVRLLFRSGLGLAMLQPLVAAERAAVAFARSFGSHMVLPRDQPIKIWGTAAPGTDLTVTLESTTRSVHSDIAGKWTATFPARPASSQPITLTAGSITLTDILIGDIWLCAGQSNLVFPLKEAQPPPAPIGHADLRLLRYTSPRLVAPGGYLPAELARCNAADFFQGAWETSTPAATAAFSAIAGLTGSALRERLHVPIGLIQVAVGSSALNNWIPAATLRQEPATAVYFAGDWWQNPAVSEPHRQRGRAAFQTVMAPGEPYLVGHTPYRWMCEPALLFEAGIASLAGRGLKGVLWYQGEGDTLSGESVRRAAVLFPQLVRSWRECFGAPDLPFVFVQLPAYARATWPAFREVQRQAAKILPHTAMIVTIDTGEADNIHPKDKIPVARRSVFAILRTAYGATTEPDFPAVAGLRVEGDRVIVSLREGGSPLRSSSGELPGFELADSSGEFHDAHATFTGPAELTLTSSVLAPRAVRYLWAAVPEPRPFLYNAADLPLGPFIGTLPAEANSSGGRQDAIQPKS